MALVCAIFSSKILNVWHASSDHSNLLSFTFVIYGGLAVSANIFGNQLIASGAIKQVVIYTLLGQLFTLLSGWYLAQFGGEFMGIALLLGQTIVLASAFVSLQFGRAGSMTN